MCCTVYNCAHGWLLLRGQNSGRMRSNLRWVQAAWARSIARVIRASTALWPSRSYPTNLSLNPEFKQRFDREARTISSLSHPHICQLFDVGSQDGTDFLVMEFLDGETLADRLRRGALPFPELLKIGIEVATALEVAHRAGIVHRDLKPSNIMLTKAGTKLMDFGLAKPATLGTAGSGSAPLLSAARTMSGPTPVSPLTVAGSVVGTIQYMSPGTDRRERGRCPLRHFRLRGGPL